MHKLVSTGCFRILQKGLTPNNVADVIEIVGRFGFCIYSLASKIIATISAQVGVIVRARTTSFPCLNQTLRCVNHSLGSMDPTGI